MSIARILIAAVAVTALLVADAWFVMSVAAAGGVGLTNLIVAVLANVVLIATALWAALSARRPSRP